MMILYYYMGIPSYFSHIVKNHSQIIKKYSDFLQINNVHNLYLDSNSIIYDCYRIIIDTHDFLNKTKFEMELIDMICLKIESYIQIIKPSNTVFIAFDGVAPVAKMDQQRSRRFKSNFEKKILAKIIPKTSNHFWDKTCITPGTEFMKKLNIGVSKFFKNKESKYNLNEIIVSGSNTHGEGEHKLFEYIRNNKFSHYSKTTIIYGLDADLIMLAINHLYISKNIYLFRETPEFIKSIDKSLDPNESYILDIPFLSILLKSEMTNLTNYDHENILQDYIFICFMLGNDFLPHFPSLNIRTKGIHRLLNAYNNVIAKNKLYIIKKNEICWKNFKLLIDFLKNNEYSYIIDEYKIREKKEKRTIRTNDNDGIHKKYLLTPVFNRTNEIYINPYESNWENRYYKTLFNIEPTQYNIKNICINYLEGLEWTFKYYTSGCNDWRWKYKYHYPPLLSDLIRFIPSFNTTMISNNNTHVHSLTQLVYVLPKDSLHFLPKNVYENIISKLISYYPENPKIVWDFCTYIWESHIDLPDLKIESIEKIINPLLI